MKQRFNKLSIIILLSIFSIGVQAQNPNKYWGYCGDKSVNNGENVRWDAQLIEGTDKYRIVISGQGAMRDYSDNYIEDRWGEGGATFGYYGRIEEFVVGEGVTTIGNYSILDSNIKSISISNTVKKIGQGAFYSCDSLRSLVIPGTVEIVGKSAFDACVNINSLTLSEGITYIDGYAFRNCDSLRFVTIPGSVRTIDQGAFANCDKLEKVTLNEGLVNLAGFYNTPIRELVIPNSVDSVSNIGECDSLRTLVIGEGVSFFHGDAVDGCDNLELVICLPKTVPEGHRPFYNQRSLLVMIVPAESYEEYKSTWYDVKEKIVIGGVFGNDLYWTYNPTTFELSVLGDGAMPDYNIGDEKPWKDYLGEIQKLKIGSGVSYVDKEAFYDCSALEVITVDGENETYRSEGNSIIKTDGQALVLGCKATVIPANVVAVEAGAFYCCSGFMALSVPASVTDISEGAFYGCPIESISVAAENPVYKSEGECLILKETNILVLGCKNSVLPEAVTVIGANAFAGCQGLETISIPAYVVSLGENAFKGCSALAEVTCYASEAPEILENTFAGISNEAVLYYPTGSDYSAWQPYFKEMKYITIEELTITDGAQTQYENLVEVPVNTLTYNRTLSNLTWNALYVPFEIPVSLLSDYDVAYINDIHSWDDDSNGSIDRMEMEVIKIAEGAKLHANHPYLIRAKSEAAKQMSIVVNDAVLYKTKTLAYDCSSLYTKFEFTGTYNKLTEGTDDVLTGAYAIAGDGAWHTINAGKSLNPFRFYMKITQREGSPYKIEEQAAAKIRIRMQGEETTGIKDLSVEGTDADVIYDLMGRRVKEMEKGRIYIINGKKINN